MISSDKFNLIHSLLNKDKFPNAIIFNGLKETDKENFINQVVQTLLCTADINKPCNQCQSCHAFNIKSHPDFYIIAPDYTKANPTIKIDQVRSLQKEILIMPAMSNCRVVLIDEADLMNVATQNCLLKTLEEPTGLTKIILITSNFSRLLMTIRSRCMIVNLNSSIDENDDPIIREESFKFLETINNLSIEDIFVKGEELSNQSKEVFKGWLINIQKYLHDLLIVDVDVEEAYFFNRDFKSRLKKLKKIYSEETIYKLMAVTNEIQKKINSNAMLELLIESYFIKMKRSIKCKR